MIKFTATGCKWSLLAGAAGAATLIGSQQHNKMNEAIIVVTYFDAVCMNRVHFGVEFGVVTNQCVSACLPVTSIYVPAAGRS